MISKKAEELRGAVTCRIITHTVTNPIKSKVLEKLYGISGTTVREIIHHQRTEYNHPIASDANGYYMARSSDELQHTIAQLRSRVKHINAAATALEHCLFKGKLFKQQSLAL